ncbi:sin3 histone deacetylase corepressor complex component SDS3-like [Mobula birostris]|uniref:sin3 histone deacetylase corepressor complex component SDS3-like n=1 Tax=Mobula birostris TaxID=1983395 RepID=UPI003B27EBF0
MLLEYLQSILLVIVPVTVHCRSSVVVSRILQVLGDVAEQRDLEVQMQSLLEVKSLVTGVVKKVFDVLAFISQDVESRNREVMVLLCKTYLLRALVSSLHCLELTLVTKGNLVTKISAVGPTIVVNAQQSTIQQGRELQRLKPGLSQQQRKEERCRDIVKEGQFGGEDFRSSPLTLVDYYNDGEDLDSINDGDERSICGPDSDEDTEAASETDIANKQDDEDYLEVKEQMYQEKLTSLKRQPQQLQEGTLQEYQKRMKNLDQEYKERIRNAELFLQLETEQVERNYIKEKKAAVKEFEDKKIELEEKRKMIENERLTMELTGDSMEVKPIMTRKLRRRPNDPVPITDKRQKPAPVQLNYLLTDEQIMEDLRTPNKLKSPKRPASLSSPEHLPGTPAESPAQRYEARIEDGKLHCDKRWYHKGQAIYLEAKENAKIGCVISSAGTNEIWVRKTSDSTKMRIYLRQLHRGVFIIQSRSAALNS